MFPKAWIEEGSFAGKVGAAHPAFMKPLVFAFLVGMLLASAARAEAPNLLVAGRGASLEQAIEEPHARDYRLLLMREQLMRVRASRAEEEVRELLERARRDGAVVFVCERDLKAERMQPKDLLPGIVTVDASSVWESGAPSAADLKLRSLCS
jgi:hypothetical protein